MRALPYGDRAVLLELADAEAVAALAAALLDGRPDGVEEIVPAARTILVRFDPRRVTASHLAERLARINLAPIAEPARAADPVVIPVVYDGADLEDVARLADLSVDAVVQRHTAARYRCGFCGFAPGFSYLIGGDPVLRVPRLDEPRAQVPAGSVAIAGEFSAVYPVASPGGWRLLGRTDARMWDLARASPALLPPGTAVRFEAIRAGA
ncbi:MAG: allophanate hydrolase subunit 1 [Pseudonocardiales bacterium]|nr:allophanate hydrolase subunit 1 [Pseudonocardiales bacterium]